MLAVRDVGKLEELHLAAWLVDVIRDVESAIANVRCREIVLDVHGAPGRHGRAARTRSSMSTYKVVAVDPGYRVVLV